MEYPLKSPTQAGRQCPSHLMTDPLEALPIDSQSPYEPLTFFSDLNPVTITVFQFVDFETLAPDVKEPSRRKRAYRVKPQIKVSVLDKSKWFRALPWEERIQTAHEEGKLILLQNLDPEYTSAEVEDIIWHGFSEICTAKMVQRTAISSPHSGQAFIIFKAREAAERVIRKLDEGCLMLSNGRPLVGGIAPPPCLPGKQSTFFGHLFIDKIKMQMQREMKQAVSTSHCSQPNTIEYEMAMEWCLLQSRSESWWKRLYKQQGEELRKLKANLKSK